MMGLHNMKQHGLVFALSALSLALTACSGGSSTLNENPSLNDGTTITECKTNDCIELEFTDEPVVGLNYRCGTVVNMTDQTGIARCPNGSEVTFFLRAKGGKREIVLGKTVVRAVRSPTASETVADAPIVRLTPIDLAATSTTKVEDIDSAAAIQAVQITRFLQAIRDQSRPYIASAPVNILVVEGQNYDIKKHIDELPENINFADFKAQSQIAALEEKLAPFLVAADRQLPSEAVAKARLEVTLRAIQAGAYYGTPTITLPVINDNDLVDNENIIDLLQADKLKLGIEGQGAGGIGSDRRATMAIYLLKDREGYSIGQGMYWSGVAKDSKTAYELYRNNAFDPMTLVNPQAGFSRFNGKIENFVWRTNINSADQQTEIQFDEGVLVGNVAMAGGDRSYRNIVPTIKDGEPLPANVLGAWKQFRVSPSGELEASPIYDGSATISKASSVNTVLEPAIWRTQDTVSVGETYVFPLHVTFTLRGSTDCSLGTCPVIGEFGATILENGNIISDLDGDCAATDADLKDTSAVPSQEYRIGVIRAAYPDNQKQNFFIGPTIMLSGDAFKSVKRLSDPTAAPDNLDGVQIGTLTIAPRVKMNIAGVINAQEGRSGSVNITDSTLEADIKGGTKTASWVNVYSSYYQLITNKTPDQEAKAKNYTGGLSVQTSSCYAVKRKS